MSRCESSRIEAEAEVEAEVKAEFKIEDERSLRKLIVAIRD